MDQSSEPAIDAINKELPSTAATAGLPMQDFARHPLRERNFRLFFSGSSISLLGDQFYFLALPWLVLQQTGSAIAMGTIMMAGAIPRAALMLMGGAMSDQLSPRKIMLVTALARSLLVGTVGILIALHILQTWELYALAVTFGIADAFEAPAEQALVPVFVKPEQLLKATSVSEVGVQLTSIVGPVPAGFIVKGLGLAWAFLIDAFSFLFIIGVLVQIPDPPLRPIAKTPIWASILEGFQYVGKDVPLRWLMLLAMSINFCLAGPIELGLSYAAKTEFRSPAILGAMLSSVAAGTLFGALVAGIWKIRRHGILIIVVAFALAILLASLGLLNNSFAFIGIMFLMGVASGLANVHIGAWIMKRIDPAVRGRVSSLLALAIVGTMPISLALAGLIIAVSLKLMFLLAGSLLLLITIAAATQKMVRQIQ